MDLLTWRRQPADARGAHRRRGRAAADEGGEGFAEERRDTRAAEAPLRRVQRHLERDLDERPLGFGAADADFIWLGLSLLRRRLVLGRAAETRSHADAIESDRARERRAAFPQICVSIMTDTPSFPPIRRVVTGHDTD